MRTLDILDRLTPWSDPHATGLGDFLILSFLSSTGVSCLGGRLCFTGTITTLVLPFLSSLSTHSTSTTFTLLLPDLLTFLELDIVVSCQECRAFATCFFRFVFESHDMGAFQ